ncbi:MAG TPA: hypothetical protein VIJ50_14175 [Solirubrobacteraceae bacterium]
MKARPRHRPLCASNVGAPALLAALPHPRLACTGTGAGETGRAIQARMVVVELQFPKEWPSASLSEGVVFVSRFKGGYRVWGVAR